MSSGRKRGRPNAYQRRGKRFRLSTSACVGTPGFLVTCNVGKEGKAAHDAMELLQDMAERFFPEQYQSAQQPKAAPGAADAGAAVAEEGKGKDGGGGDSDEDDLEAELAAMRSKAQNRRAGHDVFEAADTGVKGLVMIRMKLPGVKPSDLASKTLHHLREVAEQRSRAVARIIPMDITCVGSSGAVAEGLDALLRGTELADHPSPLKYGIDAKIRNNADLTRRGVEDLVKARVSAAHVPMYKRTDLFVVVQGFKTIAGMSIVRDYMTLRRYSAQVEGETSDTPAVSAGATMASDKDGPKIEVSDEDGAVRMPEFGAHISFSLVAGEPMVMDITETFVPEAGRGKGLAGKLARAAFEHAKEKGFHVRPTCSYISDTFVPKNPQYADIVAPA